VRSSSFSKQAELKALTLSVLSAGGLVRIPVMHVLQPRQVWRLSAGCRARGLRTWRRASFSPGTRPAQPP